MRCRWTGRLGWRRRLRRRSWGGVWGRGMFFFLLILLFFFVLLSTPPPPFSSPFPSFLPDWVCLHEVKYVTDYHLACRYYPRAQAGSARSPRSTRAVVDMNTAPVVFNKQNHNHKRQTPPSRDRPAGNEGMFAVVDIGVIRHHHHHHGRLGAGLPGLSCAAW